MTPEEREALLAGYALGSLSAPDARDAERLARSDEHAAAELAAYREIADLVALSVPLREADPALRERVLSAARRGRVWRPQPLRRYLPAAGLAAALVIVTLWAASLQSSLAALHRQTAALSAVVEADAKRLDRLGGLAAGVQPASTLGLQLEMAARDQLVLAAVQSAPDVMATTLGTTAASHGANGEYLWSDIAGSGALLVRDMPALPLGGIYRVWLEDASSRMTIAGAFSPNPRGAAQVSLQIDRGTQPVRIFVVAAARADDPSSTGPVVLVSTIAPDRARP